MGQSDTGATGLLGGLRSRQSPALVVRVDGLVEARVGGLGQVAALVQVGDGVVAQLLEGGVVLADHDGDRLDRQHFTGDAEIGGVLGGGDVGGGGSSCALYPSCLTTA